MFEAVLNSEKISDAKEFIFCILNKGVTHLLFFYYLREMKKINEELIDTGTEAYRRKKS